MDVGTFLEVDGRPAVRFVRTYRCPVDEVWSAITDPDRLGRWFPSSVTIELRVGGAVSFSGDPNVGPGTGRVLAVAPPRQLAFSWGGDELRFDVEPLDGSTQLTFTDVLEEQNVAARNAAGWTVCLDELGRLLSGEDTDGPHSVANTARFQPLYEAHIAAGVPFGADLPG
jgi:uncharacterized protein YndB with AHSA1/START domain